MILQPNVLKRTYDKITVSIQFNLVLRIHQI